MKTKTFAALVLATIFAFSFTAAALTLTPSAITLSKNDTSESFTIANSGSNTTSISLTSQTITDSNGKKVVIGFNTSSLAIAAGNSTSVLANVTSRETGLLIGEYSQTYTLTDTNNSNTTSDLTLKFINSFCNNGDINDSNLDLSVDINNNGQGDDDAWLPLDTITVDVRLDNNGDNDLKSVIYELGLYKKGTTNNVAKRMIWTSKDDEKIKVGNINSDKDRKHMFEFKVDPSEVDNSDYILVVKAYPQGDESLTCISHSSDLSDSTFGSSSQYTAEISIDQESDDSKMVVIDKDSYPNPIDAFCGETVSFSPDVYNIGDTDFDDQIKVSLVNKELGLNLEDVIFGNFNSGDKDQASFSFKVPTNAVEKTYTLDMVNYYDYDKDLNVYQESSDTTYKAFLSVKGNCESSSNSKASVSASLQSGGMAGEQLIVKVTIRNPTDASMTYNINAAGYSSWASSADVTPSVVTVGAGKSQDVLIAFDVRDTASGDETFNIELTSNGSVVLQQPVSFSIEGKASLFSNWNISGNWYVWLLGAFNVILVIVIIVVAVRLMRR